MKTLPDEGSSHSCLRQESQHLSESRKAAIVSPPRTLFTLQVTQLWGNSAQWNFTIMMAIFAQFFCSILLFVGGKGSLKDKRLSYTRIILGK